MLGSSQNWELKGQSLQAYNLILKLKIKDGRDFLNLSSDNQISDYPSLYVATLSEIIELMVTEDNSLYKSYLRNAEKRYTQYRNAKTQNPYQLFYQAELKLQWAFVYLKFGEEFSAVWNIRQAYKLINRNKNLYPEFLPNYKSLGILHVIIGSIPNKYHWILNILGLRGTVAEGIEELDRLGGSDSPFRLEAIILNSLIKSYILQQNEMAISNLENVYAGREDNLLMRYIYVSLLMKNSRSEEALQLLNENTDLFGYLNFHFLNYIKAEIYLQKKDYLNAEKHYKLFLNNFNGKNFIKDSYYKLFLTYWLSDRKELSDQYYILADDRGQKLTEADKHAASQLSKKEYPNKVIMQIRLLTDGGYYDEAELLIEQSRKLNFKHHKDKIEFTYRQARLFHKKGDVDLAIPHYLNTIESSGNELWYFAPNSALQLGYIYREKNQLDKARKFFRKTLQYKNHEYRNSIENKAKSALSQLE